MRATIKKDIREAKRQLESNIADKAKEDPKRFFQYFRSKRTVKEEVKFIRNSKVELKDTDNEIADALNLHFSEVFTSEQVDNLQSHTVRRRSFIGQKRSYQGGHIPTLPRRPDAMVKEEQLASRKLEFLEVSQMSFIQDLGPKGIWLIVKDSFIAYVRPENGQVGAVILYDKGFFIKIGTKETNIKHGVTIENLSRFVNAAGYFDMIANALEVAKEEIFITDWWLSPEIFLKRPVVDGNAWRLDCVLKRKAVIRHPDHVPSTALLWAHHEKTVIIDQSIAFLGGIDLAYGRWDDHQHRLTDVGSVRRSPQPSPVLSPKLTRQSAVIVEEEEGGLDAESNYELKDLVRWNNTKRSDRITRDNDKSLKEESCNHNLQRHKFQTKHSEENSTEENYSFSSSIPESNPCSAGKSHQHEFRTKSLSYLSSDSGSFQTQCSLTLPHDNSSIRSHISNKELFGEARIWHGKDYCNFILKDWVELNKPFDDFIDRYKTPRMPWHDIGVVVHGKAARDVARHFIQRWNFTKLAKKRSGAAGHPFLLPKSLSAPLAFPLEISKSTQASVQVNVQRRKFNHREAQKRSANINDRSMLGKRDSEIAVIVEDTEFVPSVMDGKDYKAGRFALSLRLKCFRCVPTDAVLNNKILREYMSRPSMAAEDPLQAFEELRKIRGFLVQFPFSFLSEENLFPSINSKEGMMPVELWT
ncbi:PLD1 Phospholipase, partial [Polypterus senegalus]